MNDWDFEEGGQREARRNVGKARNFGDNEGLLSKVPSYSSDSSRGS